MPPSARMRMRRDLDGLDPAPDEPGARGVRADDRAALARLMLESYRGTVDDEGEGPDEAAREVGRLLSGAFGGFDSDASEVVEREGRIVSATLVTEYEGKPLIAFSMTDPAWKRRGLARGGLLRVMARLRASGRSAAWLAVTRANLPAVALYESLGFVEDPPP